MSVPIFVGKMTELTGVEKLMESCAICPRGCAVNRNTGASGFCGAGGRIEVSAAHLHFGEEPPISGTSGSGTIFFNHCNMLNAVIFCQVVSRCQTMAAATNDDDVVVFFRFWITPYLLPIFMVGERVSKQAKS